MSKICGAARGCPFSPEQTTGGCACAELCPGYTEPGTTVRTTDHAEYSELTTTASNGTIMNTGEETTS